jgi:antitoxin ParD1/3/4/toxin ParE1/3/4
VVDAIYRAIQNVVLFPNAGHRRTDLTNRPLRFIRVRDYLIAYAPDEKPLWVIAVMHGHRSPRVMAAMGVGDRVAHSTSTLPSSCTQ